LDLDHLPELGRLTGLACAKDLGRGLEDPHSLLGDMGIAAEDPLLGLPHHWLDSRHEGVQLLAQSFERGLPE